LLIAGTPRRLAAGAKVTAADDCAALAGLQQAGIYRRPGGGGRRSLPAYCTVEDPADDARAASSSASASSPLPDAWNRFFQGGAGGERHLSAARLRAGLGGAMNAGANTLHHFAVATGHQGFEPSFGRQQARIDYATARSTWSREGEGDPPVLRPGDQAVVHHRLLERQPPGHAGRAALPSISTGRWRRARLRREPRRGGLTWDTIAFDGIAHDGGRTCALCRLFDADLALVAGGVLAACDALDGLADGPYSRHCVALRSGDAACPGAGRDVSGRAGRRTPTRTAARTMRTTSLCRLAMGRHRGLGWRSWKLGTSTTAEPNSLDIQVGFA
jgi:feruloyl esterase